MTRVPFLNLQIHDPVEKRTLLLAVERVFTHGRFILGPEVETLEKKIAAYTGRRYGVGVNSGTDALMLGLKSMGIGRGDEVIVPALSWVATANAVAVLGAVPVFADILGDLTIDPASVKRLITGKTKAILPVHYTGRMCDMDALMSVSTAHHLPIIEDAAQAFGAVYKGRKAGSYGTVACFSLNPMKVFAACGEAGMILTDDRDIRDRLLALRYNGMVEKETCIEVSGNGRIDTLQAAILLERMKRVKGRVARRSRNAAFYTKHLTGIPGIIALPDKHPDRQDVYYTYTIRVMERDKLQSFLSHKGIETKIQHPYLMSSQPVYRNNPRDTLTGADKYVREILCLPVHEKLTRSDMEYVISCVRKFYT